MYASRDQVKEAMQWAVTDTDFDDLIDRVLQAAESRINDSLGRKTLHVHSYTKYEDGGLEDIFLQPTPLVSVTSIHDDPSHEFDASALVAATDYFISDPEAGVVTMKAGVFSLGSRSVKAVFTAGYETIPSDVVQLSVAMAVQWIRTKAGPHIKQDGIQQGTYVRFSLEEWDAEIMRRLEKYHCLSF